MFKNKLKKTTAAKKPTTAKKASKNQNKEEPLTPEEIQEQNEMLDSGEQEYPGEEDENSGEDSGDIEGLEDSEDIEDNEEGAVYGPLRKLSQEKKDHKIVKIVPDDERITSNVIQLLEQTEAINIRASQIEQGSPVFTDTANLMDPILMAKKEFIDRRSPLILERPIQETKEFIIVEHWRVREMSFQVSKKTREMFL